MFVGHMDGLDDAKKNLPICTSWNKEVKIHRSESHATKRRAVIAQHNSLFNVNDTEGGFQVSFRANRRESKKCAKQPLVSLELWSI